MNIHIVTQTFPPRKGGMQTLMYSIAKGLSERNKNVLVYPDHKYISDEGFSVKNIFAPKILRPIIKRILINKNFQDDDIIICDTWKSINAVPKKIQNIICFSIGQEFLKNKNNKNIQKIENSFTRCKFVVSITKFTENLLLSKCAVKKSKLRIIFPTFSVQSPKNIRTKKANKPFRILSICRIEERKGLIQAAHALIKINKKVKDFIWNIIGDGPSKINLMQVIENSDLKNKVIFEGSANDDKKHELLSQADLFIMPGYMAKRSIEGFGIVYSEAASYGIPSIGGIDGGAPEAVINGKTGWCVNPNDEKNLIHVMIEAINNDNLRNEYGDNAKHYFEKNFSSKIVFDRLNKLIKI